MVLYSFSMNILLALMYPEFLVESESVKYTNTNSVIDVLCRQASLLILSIYVAGYDTHYKHYTLYEIINYRARSRSISPE